VLHLVVATSDEKEADIHDILHLGDEDGVFNFEQLLSDYNINDDNPILVKLAWSVTIISIQPTNIEVFSIVSSNRILSSV
jgi:hypothetical protein